MAIPQIPGSGPRDLSRPLEEVKVRAEASHEGLRLDQVLTHFLHWRSRTSLNRLIKEGFVDLRGLKARKSSRVHEGDIIVVRIPQRARPEEMAPEGFELDILYEDQWMIAVDKPAGIAVHPSGKRVHGTLIHYLHKRYRRPDDPAHDVVPRLMHRLDRETSGVVVSSLHEDFHAKVGIQFEERKVQKTYQAVVFGRPPQDEGIIDFGIGPAQHSQIRLKLEAKRDGSGQSALTRYKLLRGNDRYSLVELYPKTGRTHQLRVHMAAIGCPLVGDKMYGVEDAVFLEYLEGELSDATKEQLVLDRHALHSCSLEFHHDYRDEAMKITAPLPQDLARLVD